MIYLKKVNLLMLLAPQKEKDSKELLKDTALRELAIKLMVNITEKELLALSVLLLILLVSLKV